MHFSVKICMLWICASTLLLDVETLPIRLTGGLTPNTGRLEIYMDGKWGTIHSPGFNERCAKVACRDLGYSGYSTVVKSVEPRRSFRFPAWLRSVRCSGNESRLADCSYRQLNRHYHHHGQDVAILCLNTSAGEIPLRIADGFSPTSGNLQINMNGEWYGIYNDKFDINVAKVACRNMGFRGSSGILAPLQEKEVKSNQSLSFGTMGCRGNEAYLLDCTGGTLRYSATRSHNFHIICTDQTKDDIPLRLIDGITNNPHSGLVEIQIDGIWGKICRNSFDLNAAKVACRTMGYSGLSAKIEINTKENFSPTWWISYLNCTGSESHLLECPYVNKNRYPCTSSPTIICTNHTTEMFPARLTDAITHNSGRLGIKIGGLWGTVCKKDFDIKDANVACRHLGYSGANGIKGLMEREPFVTPMNPVWISSLNCAGTESTLSQCSFSQNPSCTRANDIAVRCRPKPKDDFPIRLVGGKSSNSGRLEMRTDGVWGTICSDQFGQAEGNVACHQLGYWSLHEFIELNDTASAPPSVPVWLDDVKCDGSESHLIECSHNGLGIHNCSHDKDVAIKCLDKRTVSARLTNGLKPNRGRLEIKIDGIWGTVCNKNFGTKEANVACRMIGYRGAYGIMDRMDELRQDSVLYIWVSKVNCTGSEAHLLDCSHEGIGRHRCRHEDDIGLRCITHEPVAARLMGGLSSNSGRLALRIDGLWGSVSANGFDKGAARVACKMLGYNGTAFPLTTSFSVRPPKSPMWMDNVRCSGTESSLVDCHYDLGDLLLYNPYYRHQSRLMYDSNDISIMCLNPEAANEVSVRLVDGMAPSLGKVEIQLEGVWRKLSQSGFDETISTVVCQMLGYSSVRGIQQPSMTESSSHRIRLRRLVCSGNETSLFDCEQSRRGNDYYGDITDIVCSSTHPDI